MARRTAGRASAARWGCLGFVCVLVVALTGLSDSVPAVALSNAGHWIYSHTLGAVVHVDGASKRVDARIPVPGLSPAEQVTDDARNGYLIDHRGSRVLVFGKTTLTVNGTVATGSSEEPDIVRTPGATYLFFADTKRVIRLGEHGTTIETRETPASPIATSDGTVWFFLPRTGDVCRIRAGANGFDCPARLQSGHRGRLVTLDDRPAFVDVTAGRIVPVSGDGLGTALELPTALPEAARIGASDAGGRLPVVVRSGGRSRLLLIDTSSVGSRREPRRTIEVPLGTGSYDAPLSAGGSVVVVDQTARTISSYDNRGTRRASTTAHAGSGPLRATRGEDGRVYIDDRSGTRTTVVDGDGDITPIDVTRDGGGKAPVPTRTSPAPSGSPDRPSDRTPTSGAPGTGSGTGAPRTRTAPTGSPGAGTTKGPGGSGRPEPGGTGTRTADDPEPPADPAPGTTDPTREKKQSKKRSQRRSQKRSAARGPESRAPSTPPSTTAPRTASAPDAPPSVTVRVTGTAAPGKAAVNWTAPTSNRAPITAYRVVWRKDGDRVGRRKVDNVRRDTTITGLASGRYTATVAAHNRAGWGPARESKTFTVGRPKPAVSCRTAVLASNPLLAYDLGAESGQLVTDASGHGHTGVEAGLFTTGQQGPCGTSAIGLTGNAGLVTTAETFTSPSVFTAEVWFRTSGNRGGALFGFGIDQSDDPRYDRSVYLNDGGHVVFGVYNSSVCLAPSPRTYNDDRWHLATASIGASGMRLYVDGRVVATNLNTGMSLSYTGRWNFGWTSLAGAPGRPPSDFFTGSLALAAVYDRQLGDAEVAKHYRKP